jgi:SAM-dependent methyltransferase
MSADEMKRYYTEDYSGEYSASETIARDMARQRIAFLRKHIDLSGVRTALEIGCAQGEFLSELALLGIDAEGLEPSRAMAALGRQAYGVKITDGVYDDFPDRRAHYDLIAMFHVLEHVSDPLGTLVRIRGELRTGGHLLLEVPTMGDCQLAIVFKTIHPTTFVAETLSAMLVKAGFEIMAVSEKGYHIQALARPARESVKPALPDARAISARIDHYLAKRRRVIDRIVGTMERLTRRGEGAVYGAGLNTLDLDQVFPLARLKLNAIFDADPRKQGRKMLGLEIRSPEALGDWKGGYIIISSYAFQSEILHSLKYLEAKGVELVTLYEMNDHG